MSEKPVLYRKRLIPSECIRLDSDEILLRSGRLLVTRWKTIRPKKTLSHGASCYLLDKGWKISRMSRMTVAVLRLALYEMRYVDDVPVGAAINEAVELAKVYDTDEAAAFINGVLGAAARAQGASTDTPAPENTDA